jgi:hypothetical protein
LAADRFCAPGVTRRRSLSSSAPSRDRTRSQTPRRERGRCRECRQA